MTTLMVHAGPVAADAAVTRTGGIPLVSAAFSWPGCRACGGPMQFLAQVVPGDLGLEGGEDVLLVFMCQNAPGLCEEWDPAAGGNQALLVPAVGLRAAVVPPGPATLLGEVSAVRCVTAQAGYWEARLGWAAREGRPQADVLGQLAGEPDCLGAR